MVRTKHNAKKTYFLYKLSTIAYINTDVFSLITGSSQSTHGGSRSWAMITWLKLTIWLKYINNEQNNFLNDINSWYPKIKVTKEINENEELPFLHVQERTQQVSSHIYRMKTHTNLYLNAKSNHRIQILRVPETLTTQSENLAPWRRNEYIYIGNARKPIFGWVLRFTNPNTEKLPIVKAYSPFVKGSEKLNQHCSNWHEYGKWDLA